MLKMMFTAEGITVTRLKKSVEKVVAQRTVLAVRLGESLHVQKGTATLLLPQSMVRGLVGKVDLCAVDEADVEVTFAGTWLSAHHDADEGVFLAVLTPEVEALVVSLWHTARLLASV
jgi:hypothetical protein